MKFIKFSIGILLMMFTMFAYGQNEIEIGVRGNCGMCKSTIEATALKVSGVQKANWTATDEKLKVIVDTDSFSADELHKSISSVGYATDKMNADEEAYQNLPQCCQYTRDHEHDRDAGEYNDHNPDEQKSHSDQNHKDHNDSEHDDFDMHIGVSGVCDMCKQRIEGIALNTIGVNSAEWSLENQILRLDVDHDLFDESELHKYLAEAGHDTNKKKASKEAYENLHTCCQYRDIEVLENVGVSDDGIIINMNNQSPESQLAAYVDSHNHTQDESYVHGMVYEKFSDEQPQPLIGATVYWLGSSMGTATDLDGFFEIAPVDETDKLIVSYIGYESDTIDMTGQSLVAISLIANNIIDDVTITYKKKSTQVSFIDPLKVQTISQKELCKAACCSLSESFETNPAVDVSFTDAVTGTRKIQMLGLAGPYVQVMRENMPYIRGIASVYGFEFTPGPWISSMQLNTGAGSVVNGPESVTGQINVEIKKPEQSEKLYVNLFANEAQRLEANVNTSYKINDRWSTTLLAHGSTRNKEQDRNDDGFYDSPLGDQVFVMNRWKYANAENGIQSQFGIKGTYVDKESGQINASTERWLAPIRTERLEGWLKLGKVFPDSPYKSIGLQLSGSIHDQDASFGQRIYDAKQSTLYANLIYQTIIGDADKTMKIGASFIADDVEETVENITYDRVETMPGAFAEYNQNFGEKVSLVLGLRGDYHNKYGFFTTPRLHVRYSPEERTAIRLAAGKGSRTASIFAENIGLFASNRNIIIKEADSDLPYGLNQEIAYNVGGSITQELSVNQRSMILSLDYYYTTFDQQIVVDYDQDVNAVNFYNLDGKSYSHSLQAQMDYELKEGLDVRLAYRYNDVKLDYENNLRSKELVPKHRAFANLAMEVGKGWSWDGTLTWQGTQRLPLTSDSPLAYQRDTDSPDFFLLNAQVTKTFGDNIDFYLGGENLLDYRQDNPIVSVDNPSNPYFDSSMIWGPVMGRNVYIGFRYTMQ